MILDTLRNAWSVKSIRQKIIFTLLMLLVFRIGAHIPVPFVNHDALAGIFEENAMFGLMNIMGGNALSNFSVFALSIIPYVTASIIMNLLTVVIPALGRLAKEGNDGRRKITQYTRYGTVILGFIQGLLFPAGLVSGAIVIPGGFEIPGYLLIALILTAGTAFLMWLGEQITEKGIGNGISLIIFAGIVASLPKTAGTLIEGVADGTIQWYAVAGLVLIITALIAGIVYVQEGQRKIPVQYAKRVVGRKIYGGQSSHIPLKVNQAGVIPLIFGFAIITALTMIASFFEPGSPAYNFFSTWLDMSASITVFSIPIMIVLALLIVFFTYFYTGITFNPVDVADNLKKQGGFIPGIRPGRPTSDYLTKILSRVTLAGGLFLAIIALMPMIIQGVTGIKNLGLGGTSLLIAVSVALDTMKQMESQLLQRSYGGFLK